MAEVKIEKLVNGYELCYTDPDIVKANQSSNKVGRGEAVPWRDPEREIAFKTSKELLAFLEKNLDKLCKSEDDYETGFTKALMESKDDN